MNSTSGNLSPRVCARRGWAWGVSALGLVAWAGMPSAGAVEQLKRVKQAVVGHHDLFGGSGGRPRISKEQLKKSRAALKPFVVPAGVLKLEGLGPDALAALGGKAEVGLVARGDSKSGHGQGTFELVGIPAEAVRGSGLEHLSWRLTADGRLEFHGKAKEAGRLASEVARAYALTATGLGLKLKQQRQRRIIKTPMVAVVESEGAIGYELGSPGSLVSTISGGEVAVPGVPGYWLQTVPEQVQLAARSSGRGKGLLDAVALGEQVELDLGPLISGLSGELHEIASQIAMDNKLIVESGQLDGFGPPFIRMTAPIPLVAGDGGAQDPVHLGKLRVSAWMGPGGKVFVDAGHPQGPLAVSRRGSELVVGLATLALGELLSERLSYRIERVAYRTAGFDRESFSLEDLPVGIGDSHVVVGPWTGTVQTLGPVGKTRKGAR